jgi:hypothetical protein
MLFFTLSRLILNDRFDVCDILFQKEFDGIRHCTEAILQPGKCLSVSELCHYSEDSTNCSISDEFTVNVQVADGRPLNPLEYLVF